MNLSRNELVAARFAARAGTYERGATLQAEIAERLARLLPDLARPKVLEAGCGTGFLTRHLLARYPDGDFLITDLAPEMVTCCRARHASPNGRAIRFAVMDAEQPPGDERFDLIALSMTAQWFTRPLDGLRRLASLLEPGGRLLYATLGPDCFPEWRAALTAGNLRHGIVDMPHLPHVVREERQAIGYGSGAGFLSALKAIGAATPRPGYRPLPPGKLRAALRRLERDHGSRVTWHIVYGMIPASDQ